MSITTEEITSSVTKRFSFSKRKNTLVVDNKRSDIVRFILVAD